jgi:iron complex transport system substrate-binding protein
MRKALPGVVCCCVAAGLGGCSQPTKPPDRPAPRVVSFSPALTEILFDMGLGEHVVGVTRFCKLPAGVQRPRVGDAVPNTEAVLAVWPSVIFTQSSPAKFQGVRDLDPDVRVVQVQLEALNDLPAAMDRIGEVLDRADLAAKHKAAFAAKLDAVRRRVAGRPRPRVLFVMGTDRPVASGPGTFVSDLIELAGGVNAGADIPGQVRWRPTHIEAVLKAAPDVLICQVSSAEQADAARGYWLKWRDLPAARAGRVYVVTDVHWSIPSTRLADLAPKLAEMIHPGKEGAEGKASAAPVAFLSSGRAATGRVGAFRETASRCWGAMAPGGSPAARGPTR